MSTESEGELNTALQYHKAGRFPEAEIIYRKVLNREPDNTTALSLLGILVYKFKKYDEAIIKYLLNLVIKENKYGD